MAEMPPDESMGGLLLGITGMAQLLAVVLFCLRMWARMPRFRMNLGWDDYFITAAVVCVSPSLAICQEGTPPNSSCLLFNSSLQITSLIQWSLNAATVARGYGRHMVYLSPKQIMHVNKYQFYSFILWAFILPFVKISIACLLFRLKRNTLRWRIFLFSMSAIQLGVAIASATFTLSLVRPIRAWWDPTGNPGAKYLSQRAVNIELYVQAGLNITTDLLFSLLPITFISRMHQPLRTRIVISFLMALGLLTTAIGAYRIFLTWQFGTNPVQDPTWTNIRVSICCVLEGTVGIIAACIPCLKRPVELVLVKLGFISTFTDELGPSDDVYPKNAQLSGYQDPTLKSWHDRQEG
jgi:hypothetical protein